MHVTGPNLSSMSPEVVPGAASRGRWVVWVLGYDTSDSAASVSCIGPQGHPSQVLTPLHTRDCAQGDLTNTAGELPAGSGATGCWHGCQPRRCSVGNGSPLGGHPRAHRWDRIVTGVEIQVLRGHLSAGVASDPAKVRQHLPELWREAGAPVHAALSQP